jgi:DNA-directed RNA polymerase specialized sigma24 family protein
MEKQSGTLRSTALSLPSPQPHEAIFQALPPLGSDEYLGHIRSAPFSDLPPEVLARAFRQLPPESEASKATLARLFLRRSDGSWDYLGPLVRYARRQSRMAKRDSYEDLLQDGLRRILVTLPSSRGEFAERSWNAFCRRELSDAWRERYGRRGERYPLEEPLELSEEDDAQIDPISILSESPPWHGTVKPSKVIAIEEIAHRVISEIPDEFIRAVAVETWFKNTRPRISGSGKSTNVERPLTVVFAGKSRFQIMRALGHANALLAAALLTDPNLELTPDLQALLTKIKARPIGSARAAKEQKK